MHLTSTAFADGQFIPAEFTCDGAGRSPPLQWSEPPAGTQSFALVVEDSDAPNGTFRHWGVYDIPMSARQLNNGAGENGTRKLSQTKNDFGDSGYGPPCPPHVDKPHHYNFRLMALDVERLPGAPGDAKAILDQSSGHVIGSANLTCLYSRP
jgi:Raf kinase inhibitor-like YbhB/YbcL family protein